MNGVVDVRNNAQDPYAQVNNGFVLKSVMQLQTQADSRVRLDLSTKFNCQSGPTTIFSLKIKLHLPRVVVLSQIQLQAGRIWIVLQGGTINVDTPAD